MYMRANGTGGTVLISFRTTNNDKSATIEIENASTSTNYSCTVNGGDCVITGDGLWHSYEVELDIPNQHTRMWVDGVQRLDTSSPFIPSNMQVDDTKFGMYWNDAGNGGSLVPTAETFWVDDCAQSSHRIGP
jgi:hypothetical protein